MTEEPYLILHKVRGLPAFDIAIRCDDMGTDTDPGPWWIIPTSGHRARPYWFVPIYSFCNVNNPYNQDLLNSLWKEDTKPLQFLEGPKGECPSLPNDWPDHYPCGHSLPEPKTPLNPVMASVLAALVKPAEPMKRRR